MIYNFTILNLECGYGYSGNNAVDNVLIQRLAKTVYRTAPAEKNRATSFHGIYIVIDESVC